MAREMLDAMVAINRNAARLIGEVADDQWEEKTPCTEWSVRDLVGHMIGTTRYFEACAGRTDAPAAPGEPAGSIGDDPAATFEEAAAATMAAWTAEGALDGDVTIPAEMPAVAALGVNLLDTGIHCWDLATAIGADHGLTDGQVALIDRWVRKVVTDDVRAGGGFGQDLDDGGSAGLRSTLAFAGRRT